MAARNRGAVRVHHAGAVRRVQHVLGGHAVVHIGQLPVRETHVEIRHHQFHLQHIPHDRDGTGRVHKRQPGILRRVHYTDRVEHDRHRDRFDVRQRQLAAVRQERRVAETQTVRKELSEHIQQQQQKIYRHDGIVAVVPVDTGGKIVGYAIWRIVKNTVKSNVSRRGNDFIPFLPFFSRPEGITFRLVFSSTSSRNARWTDNYGFFLEEGVFFLFSSSRKNASRE